MRGSWWCLLTLAACEGDEGTTEESGLAIAGSYTDAFAANHTIDETEWVQTYPGLEPLVFHVLSYDNDAEMLVAHNHPDNAYNGNLFSRFDWTEADSHLYYCQTVFDAATEEMAASAPRADDTDLLLEGCGGYPWTDLTP